MNLLAIDNPATLIHERTAQMRAAMLADSSILHSENFTAIQTEDLRRLFSLYDQMFFGGWLGAEVARKAQEPMRFRLSNTMTSAGGKTIHIRFRQTNSQPNSVFEIVIASRLLFMTFDDVQRPVLVSGLLCHDRLAALQRIMEHEILHLGEILAWGKSSCSAPRFKYLARHIFGHTDTKHNLVTPRERAAATHKIDIGHQVQFEFHGQSMVGRVNRIHHRATVLVEANDGQRYKNGKYYRKYYIPLSMLRSVERSDVSERS